MLITKLERRIEDAAVSLPIGFEKGQVFTALLHGSDNSRKPPLPVIQAMRFV